ncbi:PaaI family thioesterase [Bacillus piscicola]|uniref:PaaI family thioesterase n=1 Tax=Bacillus piscicola TaxID=1632684 RepID=UPI001F08ED3D|nr:PaaI family thioesterase [Bacillus piscicola]
MNIDINEYENNSLFQQLEFQVSFDEDAKKSIIHCPVKHTMLNPAGIVHGGVHAYLVDTAFGYLVSKYKEKFYVSVEFKTSFLKAETQGCLAAKARFVKDGKKVLFTEGTVENDRQELLSVTTATFVAME